MSSSWKVFELCERISWVEVYCYINFTFHTSRNVGKHCKENETLRSWTSIKYYFHNHGRYHGQKFDFYGLSTVWTGLHGKSQKLSELKNLFIFCSQPMHVCLLGLDSAGKTTALYRMKFDQYLNTVPTIGFNCEKIRGTVGRAKGVSFLVWGKIRLQKRSSNDANKRFVQMSEVRRSWDHSGEVTPGAPTG